MLQKLLTGAVFAFVCLTAPEGFADDEKDKKPEETPAPTTPEKDAAKSEKPAESPKNEAAPKEEAAPKKEEAEAKVEATEAKEAPADKEAEKEAKKAAKEAEKAAKAAEKSAKKAAEDAEKAARKAEKQKQKEAEQTAAASCANCKSDKCAGCQKCAQAEKGGKCDSKDCKICCHGDEKTPEFTTVVDKNAKCPNCGKKMKKCVCPPVVVDAAAKLAAQEAARQKIETERRIAAAIRGLTTSGWREAYAQLVENGRGAVPYLIDAMGNNEKPAYQLGAHTKADSGRATRQRTTAEVCCEVLTDIVKHRSNFRGEVPTVDQKAWQDWWTANQDTIVIGN